MFGFSKNTTELALSRLKRFELYCLGKGHLSPEEFTALNIELSIDAVEHVGNHFVRDCMDGKHLIWTGADKSEHDLGLTDEQNVMRDYPGFNRLRSLSLGHNLVSSNETIDIPGLRRQMTVVKMNDGSTGVAPNYKMALRNASLKMHLKEEFNAKNGKGAFDAIYGRA